MQFGRRQIDAPAVRVGIGAVQSIGPRADDAAVDDPLEQVAPLDAVRGLPDLAFLELGQQHEFSVGQGRFDAVGEADAVRVLVVARRLHNHPHRAPRVQGPSSQTGDIDQRDHLRPDRIDQIGMDMHTLRHGGMPPGLGRLTRDARLARAYRRRRL